MCSVYFPFKCKWIFKIVESSTLNGISGWNRTLDSLTKKKPHGNIQYQRLVNIHNNRMNELMLIHFECWVIVKQLYQINTLSFFIVHFWNSCLLNLSFTLAFKLQLIILFLENSISSWCSYFSITQHNNFFFSNHKLNRSTHHKWLIESMNSPAKRVHCVNEFAHISNASLQSEKKSRTTNFDVRWKVLNESEFVWCRLIFQLL